jgi:hypothetical protein
MPVSTINLYIKECLTGLQHTTNNENLATLQPCNFLTYFWRSDNDVW